MANTLTITVELSNKTAAVKELRDLTDLLEGKSAAASLSTLDERIEKEVKKPKKKAAVKVEAEEETFGEDEEETETDLEEETEETEDAEETEEETDDEDWDLSADIIPAFTAYVKRNGKAGRSQAAKILKKFGAKSVQSLDEKHYDKVMKLIA